MDKDAWRVVALLLGAILLFSVFLTQCGDPLPPGADNGPSDPVYR